jgi:hypothetical protein
MSSGLAMWCYGLSEIGAERHMLNSRLVRIEAHLAGVGPDRFDPSGVDIDAAWLALCAAVGVDPGQVVPGRDQSMVDALGGLVGCTSAQLRAALLEPVKGR